MLLLQIKFKAIQHDSGPAYKSHPIQIFIRDQGFTDLTTSIAQNAGSGPARGPSSDCWSPCAFRGPIYALPWNNSSIRHTDVHWAPKRTHAELLLRMHF